jgi:hypothetical protein
LRTDGIVTGGLVRPGITASWKLINYQQYLEIYEKVYLITETENILCVNWTRVELFLKIDTCIWIVIFINHCSITTRRSSTCWNFHKIPALLRQVNDANMNLTYSLVLVFQLNWLILLGWGRVESHLGKSLDAWISGSGGQKGWI